MRTAAEVTALAADAGRHLLVDREPVRACARREVLLEAVTDGAWSRCARDALREWVRRVTPRTALRPGFTHGRVGIEARLVEPRIEVWLRRPAAVARPPAEG